MEKTLKLILSPFNPPMDVACGLIFQIYVPYDKNGVTLLINPNLQDYAESADQENVDVRQITFNEHTKDTKQVYLDFRTNNSKIIDNDGRKVEIKLMKIGTEKIQDTEFLSFELFISDVS